MRPRRRVLLGRGAGAASPKSRPWRACTARADGSLLEARKTVRRLPEGMLVCATDVGAQRRAERRAGRDGLRLRATLEATADGILVLDGDGRIVNMNRRLAGLWQLPEGAAGPPRRPAILHHLIHAVEDPAALRTLLTTHSQDLSETFDTPAPARRAHLRGQLRPARHDDEVIGRVFCITDVTERHKAEQALIAARDAATSASKAKSDFLAMMSHESAPR